MYQDLVSNGVLRCQEVHVHLLLTQSCLDVYQGRLICLKKHQTFHYSEADEKTPLIGDIH